MFKKILLFVGVAGGVIASVNPVSASIVTIGKTGEVMVNVLSAQSSADETGEIKVTKTGVEVGSADMPISLYKKEGKYTLNISAKDGERSFDVSGYQDKILEIEERPSVRKMGISISDGFFVIEQTGVKAKTSYQINIEPQRSKITILTPSGYKFLTILPGDAVGVLYKTKSITSLMPDRTIEILEDTDGNLYYQINGTKQVGIKSLYMYDAPVSAKISAVNGEVMEMDEPIWLKILNLFTLET